jgi:VWFA-related protein
VSLAIFLAAGAVAQEPAAGAPQSPAAQTQNQSATPEGAAGVLPQEKSTNQGFSAPAVTPDTPIFKTTTRIVVLDVVVTDKRGAPVRGLKQSDFRVLENGHEQTVEVFEEHDNAGLPVVPKPEIAVEPGQSAATNAGQEIHSSALSVILFDALDTASADQSFARAQVKKVIAELPPGSRIAIFVLRGDLHMVQGFTTDTSLLAKAMDKDKSTLSGAWFNDPDMVLLSSGGDLAAGMGGVGSASSPSGMGSVLSGNGSAASNMGPATFLGSTSQRDEEGLTSQLRTAKTLAALSALAKYLSVMPGKKNLLWLAGSFPFDLMPDTSAIPGTNVPDPFRGNQMYDEAMHALAMQMEAGHIAVYPIDVRGLVDNGMFGAAAGGSQRPSFNSISASAGQQMSQEEVMNNIAHETGGRAIYNDNDIRGEIIESLNQGQNFYTVAYSPVDKNWNGKYRKIELKTGLKDVNLYYRRGYLADDPGKPGTQIVPEAVSKFAVAMLRGAPEQAEVGLTVRAKPSGTFTEEKDRKPVELKDRRLPFETHLKGTTETYALDCTVDASTVAFTKTKDGGYLPSLAFTLLAYDADGTVLNAETGMFAQALTEAQYHAVLQRGLTVRQTMEVPVGRVYLRVGVHDLYKDKVGATEMQLTVDKTSAQAVAAK